MPVLGDADGLSLAPPPRVRDDGQCIGDGGGQRTVVCRAIAYPLLEREISRGEGQLHQQSRPTVLDRVGFHAYRDEFDQSAAVGGAQ